MAEAESERNDLQASPFSPTRPSSGSPKWTSTSPKKTVKSPYKENQTIRCIGCRIAAGGGRDCKKCGTSAYQSQKHIYNSNGLNLTGIDRLHSSWIVPNILAMARPLSIQLDDIIKQFKYI